MTDQKMLAARFEAQRSRLWAIAYRMLGSLSEAEDVLQEAWLRLDRSDADEIENLEGWLTTVVARLSLNALRARKTRREEPLETHLPDPIVSSYGEADPESEAMTADAVGLALLVVLEALAPAERIAFVLHDMFAVPFDEIASITERSPAAARQLASRARRRVRGQAPVPDPDPARRRRAVDAFFAASREGDFEALMAVLDPDIVLREDDGSPPLQVIRGARAVAERAFFFRRLSPFVRPALVNGTAGVLVVPDGGPFAVMAFTVADDKIVEIDVLADPTRIGALERAWRLHG